MSGVTLRESSTLAESGRKGVYRVRIIGSDIQGSSGYYPRSVVERDVKAAFPKLTRVFADHPTATESKEMPVRSVRKIAGKIISDPWMEEDGAYADVQFGREWAEFLEDFHDVVGMSIRASGEKEEQDVDGVTRDVVTEIAASPLNSVDLVTVPGADGAVVEALKESFEAAPEDAQAPKESGTPDVTETEGATFMDKELSERFEALEKAVTSLTEALAPVVESLKPAPEAEVEKTDVAEAAKSVYGATELSESAKERAFAAIVGGTPIEEAISAEKKIADEYRSLNEAVALTEAAGRTGSPAGAQADITVGRWSK